MLLLQCRAASSRHQQYCMRAKQQQLCSRNANLASGAVGESVVKCRRPANVLQSNRTVGVVTAVRGQQTCQVTPACWWRWCGSGKPACWHASAVAAAAAAVAAGAVAYKADCTEICIRVIHTNLPWGS